MFREVRMYVLTSRVLWMMMYNIEMRYRHDVLLDV